MRSAPLRCARRCRARLRPEGSRAHPSEPASLIAAHPGVEKSDHFPSWHSAESLSHPDALRPRRQPDPSGEHAAPCLGLWSEGTATPGAADGHMLPDPPPPSPPSAPSPDVDDVEPLLQPTTLKTATTQTTTDRMRVIYSGGPARRVPTEVARALSRTCDRRHDRPVATPVTTSARAAGTRPTPACGCSLSRADSTASAPRTS